jgi:hypothetical protein
MHRSKALADLAASGAPWDLSTSPYGERTSGMEWEQLLAHLAGLAEQVMRVGGVGGRCWCSMCRCVTSCWVIRQPLVTVTGPLGIVVQLMASFWCSLT